MTAQQRGLWGRWHVMWHVTLVPAWHLLCHVTGQLNDGTWISAFANFRPSALIRTIIDLSWYALKFCPATIATIGKLSSVSCSLAALTRSPNNTQFLHESFLTYVMKAIAVVLLLLGERMSGGAAAAAVKSST